MNVQIQGISMVKQKILLLVAISFMCGTSIFAQSGDVIGFYSSAKDSTFTVPGENIEFTIRLYGTIVVSNLLNPAYIQPQIQMDLGSDGSSSNAYATLVGSTWTGTPFDPFNRTDLTFTYTIRPGDMADPMKIFGTPLMGFTILTNQCPIYKVYPGWILSNVTWRVNTALYDEPGANGFDSSNPSGTIVFGDVDMSFQNITIALLDFNSILGSTQIRWETGDPYSWFGTTNVVKTLPVSLKSGPMVDNQSSWLEATFIGPCTFKFWWNVSSEDGCDFLSYTVDQVAQNSISGYNAANPGQGIGWTQQQLSLTAGAHVIRWTYHKDDSVSMGSDCGWLANVEYTPIVTVAFDAQGGIASTNQKVVLGFSPYGVLPAATKQGYTLAKWETSEGQQILSNTMVTIITNHILFARWTTNQYLVTFNGQGAIPNPDSKTVSYDSPYGSLATVSRTGYTFGGWFTEANGNGVQVTSESIVQVLSNQTLYAKWTPLAYTVTFEAQDFTPVPSSKIVTYDAPYGVLPTATKTGYVCCWFTATNGQGQPVTSETIVKITSPQTLYAYWVVPGTFSVVPNRGDVTYQEGDTTARYCVILSSPAFQNTMLSLVAQYVVDGTSAADSLGLTETNNIIIPTGLTSSVPYTMTIKDGTAKTASGILMTPIVNNAAAQIQYQVAQTATIIIQNVAPGVDTVPSCQPTTSAVAPYNAIEINKPFIFHYIATDIAPDLNGTPPIVVEFYFQDGTAVTNSGVNGTVTNTFTNLGDQNVTMIARDKDGGERSVTFPIFVIPPPPPPSITVFDYSVPIAENDSTTTKQLTIQLSQAPIAAGLITPVVVYLDKTPTNSAFNGAITIPVSVIFYPSQTSKTVNFTVQDGTFLSATNGFTVTPRIRVGDPGDSVYVNREPGKILVQNVAPIFQQPINGSTNTISIERQPLTFNWSVSDVAVEWPAMQLLWDWGDGTTNSTIGGSGSTTHTYLTTNSPVLVSVTATDKDGDSTNISFFVTIKEAKKIIALPIGPNSAGFKGFTDLGTGTIVAPQASSTVWDTEGAYYSFSFNPDVLSVQLEAVPTPTLLPDGKKSYFFAWDGPLAIFLNPSDVIRPLASRSTIIKFPQSVFTVTNRAIFTKEFDSRDSEVPPGVNNGDLNQDGIPDRLVQRYFVDLAAEGGTNGTLNEIWLQNLSGFNTDEDYLPVDPAGEIHGVIDFRPVAAASTNQSGMAVNAYTAFIEIRGYDGILGTDDDPGTNPTINDTDNDEYPDGWEYWFWYQSKINGRTGLRYNPNSSSQTDIIDNSEIMEAFDPLTPRSLHSNALWRDDFDNDGLLDLEELVLGTDPTKCNNIGFNVWAQAKGLAGAPAELFLGDRDSDGIQNGFEYAFGTNLPLTELLLNIRFVNGRMVVDIPKQDETTTPFVRVQLKGSTNLTDWTLQTVPAQDTTGKPSNRDWKEPAGTLGRAFFKLHAELK